MGKLLNGKYPDNTLLVKPRDAPEFEIRDYRGLQFLQMNVNAPQTQSNFINLQGIDGSFQQGPVLFGARTATINFFMEVDDGIDFDAKIHEVWNMFYSRTLVRLRQSDMPGICVYGIVKPFEVTHISRFDKSFSIEFDLPSGYRYSVLRSTDFPINVKDNIHDGANIGMNLPMEELKYTHPSGEFKIFNPLILTFSLMSNIMI